LPIFRIDPSSRQTYGEDLVGASRTLSAVASDAERLQSSLSEPRCSSFNNQLIERAVASSRDHPV
jgi:hypothetical protein